jgi:hypothetical protein
MTPYGIKLLHLIDAYIADLHFDGFETIRQHIEQGEPDCRTCLSFPAARLVKFTECHQCINFSQYKRADYKPLCEVLR